MIKPPPSNDINRIADWIELYVIFSGASISKSKALSILQKELQIDEQDIDSVIQELKRRLSLYGGTQPFRIEKNNIIAKFNWKKYPYFALCLYYSTYGVGVVKKGCTRDMGTKLFEDITKECLEKSLQSPGFLFGFPSPVSFKVQLDEFAKHIKEKRLEDPNPHDKDRDVDLILCKTFDDIRNNCMLFFVQCAAGKNWDEKKPVAIESYRRFLSFNDRKTTISSLATTQVVDVNDWQNACDDYGIILDRARLYRVFSQKTIISKKLNDDIVNWCKAKLN